MIVQKYLSCYGDFIKVLFVIMIRSKFRLSSHSERKQLLHVHHYAIVEDLVREKKMKCFLWLWLLQKEQVDCWMSVREFFFF